MQNYNIKIYNRSLNSNIPFTINKSSKTKVIIVFENPQYWTTYNSNLTEKEVNRLYSLLRDMNIEKIQCSSLKQNSHYSEIDDVRNIILDTNYVSVLSIYLELCKRISQG